jgi:hypothetical protein
MLPAVGCAPIHAPLAVHAVALVDDHVSVELWPTIMGLGATLIVTVGAAGGEETRIVCDVDVLVRLAESPLYDAVTV